MAYLAAPLLAFAVGEGLSEAGASDGVAVAGASTMFLAPLGVHLYHGAGDRSLTSLASMLGITLAGTLAGGAGGYLENQLDCDPDRNSECKDRGIGAVSWGAGIGSIVGYVVSAVVDVAYRSSAPEATRSTAAAQVWLAPLGSASGARDVGGRRRSAATRPLEDGLVIGVTLGL